MNSIPLTIPQLLIFKPASNTLAYPLPFMHAGAVPQDGQTLKSPAPVCGNLVQLTSGPVPGTPPGEALPSISVNDAQGKERAAMKLVLPDGSPSISVSDAGGRASAEMDFDFLNRRPEIWVSALPIPDAQSHSKTLGLRTSAHPHQGHRVSRFLTAKASE